MTIADPYLFVALRCTAKIEIAVSKRLDTYFARMKQLPSVATALAEEGLT